MTIPRWMSALVALPWEERALEVRFGDSYLAYKKRVPRWLGWRARTW